jgi:hypothetical protein
MANVMLAGGAHDTLMTTVVTLGGLIVDGQWVFTQGNRIKKWMDSMLR